MRCLKHSTRRRSEARADEAACPARLPPRFPHFIWSRYSWVCLIGLCVLFASSVSATLWAQAVTLGVPVPTKPEPPRDALGRTTPRGTVLGFLSAAHKEDYETAARYLTQASAANQRLHSPTNSSLFSIVVFLHGLINSATSLRAPCWIPSDLSKI